MTIRQTMTFLLALAIASPATAQSVGIGPVGPVGPAAPVGPVGSMKLGPLGPGPVGPLGPGPVGPGPIGVGPVGPGPVGLGPVGPGPMGLGPFGPGPIGPGPVGPWDEQDREQERQDREREQRDREAERARAERDRETSLYEQGNNALYEGRYDRAVASFSRLIEMKGTRVDSALYWKAYAQNRLGQRAEALATIAELTKGYPNSSYLKQARSLAVEVQGAGSQAARPESQADEDLKLIAINALAHSDPEQAVPLLEKILNGNASPRLKVRALFVLAQINSPRAREVVKNVAKGSTIPELQNRAIQYLGTQGGLESRATLAEIYSSTTDIDVKRRILRSFMAAGEKSRLFAVAQTEPNAELRLEAVRQLGAMGANDELWQMYQKENSLDVKRQILSAMQAGGNVTRMIDIAKSEKDPELRRIAVRNLGVMGSKAGGDALVEIYGSEKDLAIRRSAINSLFIQGNATALVTLARKEQDISLKTEMVQKLANMDSKIARDYMIELLK